MIGSDWFLLGAPSYCSGTLLGVSVAGFRPDLDAGGRYARSLVALLDQVL